MTVHRTRRSRRTVSTAATAISVAVHALLLSALWLYAPRFEHPRESAGPPEPVIPVLILPRPPPAPPGSHEKPQPIRLHRRRLHPELPETPEVAPLVAPRAPEQPPEAPGAQAHVRPRATVQPSPSGQIAAALRASPVGCANLDLLSPDEREACLARLGRGAAGAPYLPPMVDRGKQAALDEAARDRNPAGPIPAGPALPGSDSGASNKNKPLYAPTPPPLNP
jgi:hypothetical protein